MPEIPKYKAGFGLHEGLIIAGYKLKKIDIKHEVKEEYHYYTYPTELTFIPTIKNADVEQFIDEFDKYILGEKIIYTDYGNPYRCNSEEAETWKGILKNNGTIILTAVGGCRKI